VSILTKICVVVLLVLILLAVPVFITQATVAPNWRYAYEQERKRSKQHAMDARFAKLALDTAKAELDAALTARNRTALEKRREIDRLTNELASWQTKAAELQNSLKRLTTEVAGLKLEIQTANKRTDLLSRQLADARGEVDKLTQEAIQLNDLLKQTEAEKERLDAMARDLKESKVALEEELEQLRQQKGTVAASEEGQIVAAPAETIVATLTDVKGDYASINVGSAKGIKRGMKLIVFRGGEFVSKLRIDMVDPGQAAGVIIDRRLDPVQGDKVTTRLLK